MEENNVKSGTEHAYSASMIDTSEIGVGTSFNESDEDDLDDDDDDVDAVPDPAVSVNTPTDDKKVKILVPTKKKKSMGGKTQPMKTPQCELCGETLPSLWKLRQHMQVKHKREYRFKCMVCFKGFHNRPSLNRHKIAVHMRLCDKCETYVTEIDPWDDPGITRKTSRFVICGHCQNPVDFHSRTFGKTNDSTASLDDLKTVIKVNLEERDPVPSEEITDAASSISSLPPIRPRKPRNLDAPRFSCVQCGKLFFREYEVLRHQMTHSNVRQLMCEICGARFYTPGGVTAHLRKVHYEIKYYPCLKCGKQYRTKMSLINHMDKKHDVKMTYAEVRSTDQLAIESTSAEQVEVAEQQVEDAPVTDTQQLMVQHATISGSQLVIQDASLTESQLHLQDDIISGTQIIVVTQMDMDGTLDS